MERSMTSSERERVKDAVAGTLMILVVLVVLLGLLVGPFIPLGSGSAEGRLLSFNNHILSSEGTLTFDGSFKPVDGGSLGNAVFNGSLASNHI